MAKIEKLSKAQLQVNGVQALGDKPQQQTAYGQGGLNATSLKQWFDKMPLVLLNKINEIIESLEGTGTSKIDIAIDGTTEINTIDKLIASMKSGTFADEIIKLYPSVSQTSDDDLTSLQAIIDQIAEDIADNLELITSHKSLNVSSATAGSTNDPHGVKQAINSAIASAKSELDQAHGSIASLTSTATSAASSASTSASNARTSASNANSSAESAARYELQAKDYKEAAETSEANALSYKGLAETAYSNAQGVLQQVNAKANNITNSYAFDTTNAFISAYSSPSGVPSITYNGVTYALKLGDDIYIKQSGVSDLWYSDITETDSSKYWNGLPFSAQETDKAALSAEVASARGYKTEAENAKSAAVIAQGKAEEAQGKAEEAQGKAETAQGAAESAQGECEEIYGQVDAIKTDVLEAIEDFEDEYGEFSDIADTVASHSTEIADLKTRVNTLEDIQELDITKIQQIVQNGVAKKYIQVGDVISTYKETSITANIRLSQGITSVTIDANTFMSAYGHSFNGEVMFIYDDSKWYLHEEEVALATYGLTVVGSARNGDEIIVHETSAKLKFDVMDFDTETPTDETKTHSLPLLLQDVYSYGSLPFCNAQLLYWARDGLSAGTYYFRCYRADYNCTNNDYYMQFTIANDIEAGGGFRHNRLGTYQSNSANYSKEGMLAGNIITYGAMVNTNGIYTRPTIETVSVTEGQSGTYLGCFSAEFYSGYTTVDEQHNATRRNGYGNNRWDTSYHRQWLNSNASANSGWYTPQSNFDMPPSEALQKWAGFLNGLDADFVSAIGTTKQKCAYGSWDRGMGLGDYYETEDKIFYASMTNMNLGNNNGVAEGSSWKYWQDHNTNSDRIKYQGTTARYWWLRSCHPSICNFTRYIYTSGALNNNGAFNSHGVVPACVIV